VDTPTRVRPSIAGRRNTANTNTRPTKNAKDKGGQERRTSSDALVFSASSPFAVLLSSFLDGKPTAAGLLRVLMTSPASSTSQWVRERALMEVSESPQTQRAGGECTEAYPAPLTLLWAPIPPVLPFCELLHLPLPCAQHGGSKILNRVQQQGDPPAAGGVSGLRSGNEIRSTAILQRIVPARSICNRARARAGMSASPHIMCGCPGKEKGGAETKQPLCRK
jgi:hypothetical protein